MMARIDLETRRNLFHLGLGVSVLVLFYFDLVNAWSLMGALLIGFLVSLTSRRKRIPVIGWFLEHFEREEVIDAFPGKGAFFITLGFLLSIALFPKDIALAAIAILTFGDSVCYLFGTKAGRIKHPLCDKKFIEGNIFGFLAAVLAASIFVSPLEAFLASAFAMTMEAIDSIKGTRIEDNITIPIVAGGTITLLRLLF
jgi:dolichol kinase